ncbi:phage holin family protein [Paenibacillus sp. J5C_2022]|uniref:phage holin family protein n=1 Tax=Paenibacillus sp. J5C2022 TaxID=2977129 RepID=UPI0021D3C34B|nr:phage holin family protein [Paenibacillus sp. J5C2022]MCU6709371.1 phage holin family protein [Paenibacillus sp. J5C2022]
MINGQALLNGGAGVVGGFIGFAYGGWSEALTFLLIAFAVDIVSGIVASRKEGVGLSSSIARAGFAGKGMAMLVLLLSHRIDVLLELDAVILTAATYFYIANELLSIVENYGRAGYPLPDKVKDVIDVLKRKGDVSGAKPKGE